jgi:hypothetical protein
MQRSNCNCARSYSGHTGGAHGNETRSDLVSHASVRDGLSVEIHPDSIAMDQSDHADSQALPCQQECFAISSPIHQRSLFD